MKKNIIKIIMILIIAITFGGCYTVLWQPEESLPNESYNQIYYSEPYYGDYNYYYDYPWWLTIGPPANITQPKNNERGSGATIIRNGGERNTQSGERPIINTSSPTKSSSSDTSSQPAAKRSSDNNSSTQSRSSDNSRNDNSGSTRNNNGSRNSGNGRK
jgi:hypothetical protein